MLSFLSPENITDQVETGRVKFDSVYNVTKANQNKAIESALSAFSDGLFVAFLGDKELKELDSALTIDQQSEITFIRMTFLTGSYW